MKRRVTTGAVWVSLHDRITYGRLQDSHVLRLPQRIAARYLLFSCWPSDLAGNPFRSFLIKVGGRA